MIKTIASKIYSYLTISLLVICLAMGGIIYTGYAKVSILNNKVSEAQAQLLAANDTISNLREENVALNSQLSELLMADKITRERFGSIEDEWEELVRSVTHKDKVVKKESGNETSEVVDGSVDLSGYFRLLLESACTANNCVRNNP